MLPTPPSLQEQMSIGGSLRYIHSNLTGYLSTNSFDARPGNSVAVDFGMYYNNRLSGKTRTWHSVLPSLTWAEKYLILMPTIKIFYRPICVSDLRIEWKLIK